MRTWFVVGLTVVLLIPGPARAQGEARAVIDKALQVMGGADKIAKVVATRAKTKGTLEVNGMNLAFTAEAVYQFPDQMKSTVHVDLNGQQFDVVQVYNGDQGWMAVGGNTMDMPPELLKEMKEALWAVEISTLRPLAAKDAKGLKLAPLGEVSVDGRPAVGVKVEAEGRRDVNLFFDKEKGWLVRVERRGLIPGTMEEGDGATTFSDYRPVDGVPHFHKMVMVYNGKKVMEQEILETKAQAEKVDANEFSKP